jgi:gluconolactonase
MKNLIIILCAGIIVACGKTSKTEQTQVDKITITSPLEKLATGFKFVEGPAADKDGNVYFTDFPNQRIHIWILEDSLTTFREESNGANGLYFDNDQNLLACEGYAARISRTTPDGDYAVIASEYEGKPFNSTNDLWPDKKGGVYFTDPQYGGDMDNLNQGGMHVYYLLPDGNSVIRVCEDMVRPNGIIGTPDGKTLYVSDRGDGKTYQYSINADGTLSDKKLFVEVGSDGMSLDEKGNLYITTKGKSQVDVYSKTGEQLKTIEIPESPTNVTFGGKNKEHLYITAQSSLYRVGLNVKG